ncbi:MAG: hypothetical protein KC547_21285 [Anaerolineae bacterium]|nr:hypothetical protein [Anaerolineae bacterium]
MTIVVNQEGLEQAIKLVEKADFRLNSVWAENRPSTAAEDRYIADQGLNAFGLWHLAINTDAQEDSKERYAFPYGDFRSLHSTSVEQIRHQAQLNGQGDLVQAADEILDLLVRFTC